jgi:hypothetical protein
VCLIRISTSLSSFSRRYLSSRKSCGKGFLDPPNKLRRDTARKTASSPSTSATFANQSIAPFTSRNHSSSHLTVFPSWISSESSCAAPRIILIKLPQVSSICLFGIPQAHEVAFPQNLYSGIGLSFTQLSTIVPIPLLSAVRYPLGSKSVLDARHPTFQSTPCHLISHSPLARSLTTTLSSNEPAISPSP